MSRRSTTRSDWRLPVAIVSLMLLAAAGWFGLARAATPTSEATRSHANPTVQVHGLEAVPSTSVKDWAAIADYVVVGTVAAEQRLEPPQSETSDPADELIGRDVTVDVDELLWRSPQAERSGPSRLTFPSFGWNTTESGETREIAPGGGSRLEVGHTYVLALVWKAAECSGDERIPARWSVIGSGGAIPADDRVIGQGEFEGDVREATDQPTGQDGSVMTDYAGVDPSRLVPALEGAEVDPDLIFEGGNTQGCD